MIAPDREFLLWYFPLMLQQETQRCRIRSKETPFMALLRSGTVTSHRFFVPPLLPRPLKPPGGATPTKEAYWLGAMLPETPALDDKAALLSVLPPASFALLSSPSYPGGSSSVEFSLPAPSETLDLAHFFLGSAARALRLHNSFASRRKSSIDRWYAPAPRYAKSDASSHDIPAL